MQVHHNNVRKTVINQHTRHCTNMLGIQISTLNHDNVKIKVMLNNLNRQLKVTNSMCRLMLEMIRNGTTTSNGLNSTMEKLEQETDMSKTCANKEFENNSALIDHLPGIKANNITSETSVLMIT